LSAGGGAEDGRLAGGKKEQGKGVQFKISKHDVRERRWGANGEEEDDVAADWKMRRADADDDAADGTDVAAAAAAAADGSSQAARCSCAKDMCRARQVTTTTQSFQSEVIML
jgi:hypothetical protein